MAKNLGNNPNERTVTSQTFTDDEAKALIPGLIEALRHDDLTVCSTAAKTLAKIGPPAIPSLTALLHDKDAVIRQNAVYALKEMGKRAKPAIPALLELLRSRSHGILAHAVETLGNIGPEAETAIPALVELLRNKDLDLPQKEWHRSGYPCPLLHVRHNIATALAKIGPAAIPTLLATIREKNRDAMVEPYAVSALGNMGPKARVAIPDLIKMLNDDNSKYLSTVVNALEQIHAEPELVVPALAKTLKNNCRSTRHFAAKALKTFGPKASSAVPELIESLKDTDSTVQYAVAEALGEIGQAAKPAIPVLVELIKNEDTDSDVSVHAATALGKIGPASIPALLELLCIPNQFRREVAARALAQTGQDSIPALAKLLTNEDYRIRLAAVWAVGSIGSDACRKACKVDIRPVVPIIEELLKDKDWRVRFAAGQALGTAGIGYPIFGYGDGPCKLLADKTPEIQETIACAIHIEGIAYSKPRIPIAVIVELLKHEDNDIRYAAATALGNLGRDAKSAVPALVKSLKDRDEEVRLAAASALGEMKTDAKEAIPSLKELCKDENLRIRRTAVRSLGKMGPAAIPALAIMVKDKDRQVRIILASALAEMAQDTTDVVPPLLVLLQDEEATVRRFAAQDAYERNMYLRRNERFRRLILTGISLAGPAAKAAIPDLKQMLDETRAYGDTWFQHEVMIALKNIGPETTPAAATTETPTTRGVAAAGNPSVCISYRSTRTKVGRSCRNVRMLRYIRTRINCIPCECSGE